MARFKLNQKGSLLIVCLWGVSILALMAFSLARYSRVETLATQRWIAEGALERAGRELTLEMGALAPVEMSNRATGLTSPWVNHITPLTNARAQGAWFHPNRAGEEIPLAGWSEEESKVNINTLEEDELIRLFWGRRELAETLLDWRDQDGDRRKFGVERSDLPPETPFRDGPLRFPQEIFLIPGITQDLGKEVINDFTVFGDGRVNWNTASPRTLEVLGVPRTDALALVYDRLGPDGFPGTNDDKVAQDATDALNVLNKEKLLTKNGKDLLLTMIQHGKFKFQGRYFRWTGLLEVNPGPTHRRVSLVIAPWMSPGKILQWTEFPE